MAGIEEKVMQVLEDMVLERVNSGRAPYHVLRMDLAKATAGKHAQAEVDKALNSLYRAGKIKVGNTINDKFIALN